MTDEEKAEEYATENWEYYEEGQNDSKALKQAYLAGFKAGQESKDKLIEKMKCCKNRGFQMMK